MRTAIILGLLCALTSCTSDVDPIGRWAVTAKYGAGDCFPVGGTGATSFTVAENGSGYLFIGLTPEIQVEGTAVCNAVGCSVTVRETAPTGTILNWSLTLAPDDTITGSGNMNGTNPTCLQAIVDVSGTKS